MNGRIDWDAIHGAHQTPAPPPKRARKRAKAPSYSDDQIAQAVAVAGALPGKNKDPNKIKTPWARPDAMPTLADVDFKGLSVKKLPISSLMASNKNIGRDKLVWHIQHPGQAKNPSPFTTRPLVMANDEGNIIIDGHHRLFANQLLGETNCSCWVLPSK